MINLKIPEKLERFLEHKRFKVAYGGRGAGKSQTFADLFLVKAFSEQAKIGCFREMQNSIEDSVHSLLKDEIESLGFPDFTTEKASIYHKNGGEFRFKGLARNPSAVKSMHGFKYFWVEEAQSISQDSLKMLTPTARAEGSEVWFSMNPQSSEDPMSKRFILPFQDELLKNGYYEDDLHLIVNINYIDNPWFPASLEQERRWDFESLPRAEYDHIWLGHFNDSVDNSIIKTEWFDACIDAHKVLGFEPRGQKILAHDPSDTGDAKGLALRHGSVFLDIAESSIGDVNEGCDWALDKAIENKVDIFTWDADGLGLTLKRQVSASLEGKKIEYKLFKGSEGPENPEESYEPIKEETEDQRKLNKHTFKNKRAQYYWKLRDRMFNTYRAVVKKEYKDPEHLISISSDIKEITKIRAEVCRLPRKSNGSGLIQLMSKDEMKNKYKINSPNMADSMMMAMLEPDIDNDFFKEITYDTRGIY